MVVCDYFRNLTDQMRVIHSGIQSEPAIGVLRQLEGEAKASQQLGIGWYSLLYTGKSMPSPANERSLVSSDNRLVFRLAYYRWLYKKSRDFDVILLRYSYYDPLQLLFVLLCGRTVYSVHHTLEVPELSIGKSLSARIKTVVERLLGPLTLSCVDGIIAVAQEMLDYELERRLIKRPIPHKVYTNGVDYYNRTDLAASNVREHQNPAEMAVPEILFISSAFPPWQGLEELITAAGTYTGDFVCHIVGELTEQQSQMMSTDSRFIAHGLQGKEYINKLIAKSDVGLSALTVYKKNLKSVPALKVREYLMEGLAVYAGHGDVLPDSFAYYKNGPVDITEIVSFAIENRNNDRVAVSEMARPYIEKELLVMDLHTYLRENWAA